MILSRPTGVYRSVLPKVPSDPTSVVYTISNNNPPRSVLDFQQIPTGVELMVPVHVPIPEYIIRQNMGALVYTVKATNNAVTQSGNQLFYPGQIIEFSETIAATVVPMDSAVETQHDQHYIDPASVGLDQSSMDEVAHKASEAQKMVLVTLDGYQTQQTTYKADIVSQQKIINEANRIISGIDSILLVSPDENMQRIKTQMEIKVAEAQTTIDNDIMQLDNLNVLIQGARDQLTALAVLID